MGEYSVILLGRATLVLVRHRNMPNRARGLIPSRAAWVSGSPPNGGKIAKKNSRNGEPLRDSFF
jgi:hypothetical protein